MVSIKNRIGTGARVVQAASAASKKTGMRGQGLVEYILIVALMGILAIAAISKMGEETQRGFTKATKNLKTEFDRMGG